VRIALIEGLEPAAGHGAKQDDDHDEIDPEHGKQRDDHPAMLASCPAWATLRGG